MYISKLKIQNFKCFQDVEITFDPNFNLIIGENNSGKSTVFEALRLWQLAIQQFYKKRTGKTGDGNDNIGFYIKTNFEPLESNDLSFLRIDSLYNVLHKKKSFNEEDNQLINDDENTFLIELIFSNDLNDIANVPIVFRPRQKTNVLTCSIKFSDNLDNKKKQLTVISHSLSKVIRLSNNATFINRVRLAYISPKFTLPNKEILLATDSIFITEKLISGESHLVIRNILHKWCEFSYQVKTKSKSYETISKAVEKLRSLNFSLDFNEKEFEDNFELIKPFIQTKLEYDLVPQFNSKSQFLKKIEESLKTIITQEFYFKSINNPIEDTYLKIDDINKNTEISQLGSGTINILNILSVLNYNDETINKRDATRCNVLLLDEPDSHLQFNLQKNLFDFLKDISSKDKKNKINKQIFIITHNSSLISQSDRLLFIKNNVKLISPIPFNDYLENHLKNIDENHFNVMKELYEAKKEKENLEKQLSNIKNVNIPLVFTEGESDVIILNNAFKKLYPSEQPFFGIINSSCASQLRNTFQNKKTFEKCAQPHIAFFDFDTAFNEWNGLWGGKESVDSILKEVDPYKALSKKHASFNAYAILLPVPNIEIIKRQVLNSDEPNKHFGNKSVLQIEHLFYEVNSLKDSFKEESTVGNGKCVLFRGDKVKFANDTSKLTKEDFKHFIPLFKKIAEIIGHQLPIVEFDN